MAKKKQREKTAAKQDVASAPEKQAAPKKKGLGVGSALRQAREKKRWSLDRVASKTKIKADYLRALEQEEFEKLDHQIYLRLFLRSYAKELGLDGEKLLALYQAHLEEQKPSHEEETQRLNDERKQAVLKLSGLVAGGLVIIGLIGGLAVRWSLRPVTPRISQESLELAADILREGASHFRVRGLNDTWLQVVENDVNTTAIVLKRGEIRSWRTTGFIKFKVGNAHGLEAEWQGRPLGVLGSRGQVVAEKLSADGEEN